MCTLYAIKTRNVPENFNEAKFIGFTMYTTIVIWIAFVVIYLSSDHKVTTMSLCVSFSALFALFLLFFPRCYIIIFKAEKNNRSFFTTTKNVRCHIGYQVNSNNNNNNNTVAAFSTSSSQVNAPSGLQAPNWTASQANTQLPLPPQTQAPSTTCYSFVSGAYNYQSNSNSNFYNTNNSTLR